MCTYCIGIYSKYPRNLTFLIYDNSTINMTSMLDIPTALYNYNTYHYVLRTLRAVLTF